MSRSRQTCDPNEKVTKASETGKAHSESQQMRQTEFDRPLQADALREIERSVYGKLRAHRLSDAFIARHGEDAIQRAVVEYLGAIERGVEIDNRDAFVVEVAFRRAIDELRHETRRSDSTAVEAILESGRVSSPPSEELAVEELAAEEVRRAVRGLSAEERQALSLHYFEELSNRSAAERLYCSERTFRRLLKKALCHLGHRLGAPVPERDSELAIEVGLAAWVSLHGATVVFAHGPFDPAVAFGESVREAARWGVDRVRDFSGRWLASGAGERAAEIASGPVGKAGGACTGALALCLLGGVVGPGAGGLDLIHGHEQAPRASVVRGGRAHHNPPTSTSRVWSSAGSTPLVRGARSQPPAVPPKRLSRSDKRKREVHQVREQTSGFARAASESESPASPPPVDSTASTQASTDPSGASPSTSGTAAGEEQVKQQFGGFK